ncbi:MAG: hypothetical protein AAFN93_15675 [Bacteroidota bacterium]
MNKTKIVIVGLLIAYSIYMAWSILTSDMTSMLEGGFEWQQILILFPITVLFCVLIWTWGLPKFFRRLRDPNYPVAFPNMKNRLSESPLEWIYMLALFFIIPSISFEFSTLLGHGQFNGFGFIGIAYGLGFLVSIYLIWKKKQKGV